MTGDSSQCHSLNCMNLRCPSCNSQHVVLLSPWTCLIHLCQFTSSRKSNSTWPILEIIRFTSNMKIYSIQKRGVFLIIFINILVTEIVSFVNTVQEYYNSLLLYKPDHWQQRENQNHVDWKAFWRTTSDHIHHLWTPDPYFPNFEERKWQWCINLWGYILSSIT